MPQPCHIDLINLIIFGDEHKNEPPNTDALVPDPAISSLSQSNILKTSYTKAFKLFLL
jgi:hypothetical protein